MEQTTDLARAKAIVRHLVDSWSAVLRQRQYLHTIGDSQALIAALEHTYAAHVHNAIGAVLVMDLIRAVCALILDRNSKTASAITAIELLSKEEVLRALSAEMADVKPGRFVDESAARTLSKALSDHAEGYYKDARADLDWIVHELLSSHLASTLRAVRDKAVAHNDLVRDGSDWKLWHVEGSDLTYGQLDAFIDCGTEAIDKLAHVALRCSHAFAVEPLNAQLYAEEYVQALTLGLQQLRAARSRGG